MKLLNEVDLIRIAANEKLDPKRKGALGQFFTPTPISLFMSSLFKNIEGPVKLLDPGCGPGSLAAAFVAEAIKRNHCDSLKITAFDVEELIVPYINETKTLIELSFNQKQRKLEFEFVLTDYILASKNNDSLFCTSEDFTHVVMNPPYKKIAVSSEHRKALRAAGIETVNLYSGFVALAIQQLSNGGELVVIIPRSFCNGPYYQSFRELILKETAIMHIHIFDSRRNAFSEDSVLQENIILHLIKGKPQQEVTITSSPSADFYIDEISSTVTASDMTTRVVSFDSIVSPKDKQNFIHIAANNRDQGIIDALAHFGSSLNDIGIKVSTGPVVDFRLKSELRKDIVDGAVPLIYPVHLKNGVNWPFESKKPNAIIVSKKSRSWLWQNQGYFVIVRRFSSKEEKRRIVATTYDGSLPGELIGFENKLNVFHVGKSGMDKALAIGLTIYLNCSLLDKYYRLFGGHTQVNATDLRTINYPDSDTLRSIGKNINQEILSQIDIDILIEKEINNVSGIENSNPLKLQEKIEHALEIIAQLGMPRAQQNERSALTFLALINLHPTGCWKELESPLLGVTPIMDWCRDIFGKEYAPNTRESFRRQTLHQFVDGGIALYNPDKPDRPVNSPKACYQISPELADILSDYGTDNWESSKNSWLENKDTLIEQYAKKRDMEMIPLILPNGTKIKLSPGDHSQLIHDIVVEFGPRFAPGSEVIYLGDTGAKEDFFDKERLAELGVIVDRKGKLPDVVLYWPERDWLLLIESVTTHGPVDGKRHSELSELFSDASPGIVYVTAFPNRKIMGKYLGEISWETEVWFSDSPTHMIHFNGDRFLGPHS